MEYSYLKALHLIFVITWFAGLFYIVRLYIYHVEAFAKPEEEQKILCPQYALMERRLWYGITWPSAVLTLFFGLNLLKYNMPLDTWLKVKLGFLLGLFSYHFYCGTLRKKINAGKTYPSSMWLRFYNEVATIFLVAIVFLAVLKDTAAMGKGLLGLCAFSFVLVLAIRFYKKFRS